MPRDLKTEKNAIRRQCLLLRDNIESERKRAMDAEICGRFLSLATYRLSDTVLLYAPLGSEVDIFPVFSAAIAAGKTVAFPRCEPFEKGKGGGIMHFYRVESPEDLEPGHYGVREPKGYCERLDPSACGHRICAVPAVAFDRDGYRLGYGKGYYDRYLGSFSGVKVGITYSSLILDRVPRGRFDLAVDLILCEKNGKKSRKGYADLG